jgi:hypothetical protein
MSTSLGIPDPIYISKFNPIPVAQGRQVDDENILNNEAVPK